jgi:hypothetical protein
MRRYPSKQQSSFQQQVQKVAKRIFKRKSASVSPLKQRAEEVLRGDRRAIQDPLAEMQAIFLID